MKNFKILLSLSLFFIVCLNDLKAQPGAEDPGPAPVPITGIEYLIAAGAAFGAKKLYDRKKK